MTVESPRPGVSHVALSGEHAMGTIIEIARRLDPVIAGSDHLIIDLSGVTFIDSKVIALLLRAHREMTSRGGRFNLVVPAGHIVERVLEIADVLALLNRVEAVEEAVAGTGTP